MLVYRLPLWARAGSEELGEEEEAQPRLFLAFLNQSSLPFLQPSLAAGIFLSFGYLHYLGSRIFYVGATFLYRGKLGFFKEPYLVPPLYFLSSIYASGYSRHHLLGCQGAASLPRCLGWGSWSFLQRGHTTTLAQPEGRGVCACGGGHCKVRGGWEDCPLELSQKGGPRAWQKCHFWQVWKFPNKFFCLLVVSRPGH